MDDLEEEKNFDSKGKILKNVNSLRKYFEKVFNGYPRKNVTKNFAYFFDSEHTKHFFLENNLHFLAAGGGVDPPPLREHVRQKCIFLRAP